MARPHPLVSQLKFARSQWLLGLEGLSAEEATRRFAPINSISWMIGHLAGFEQRIWVDIAQGVAIQQSKSITYEDGAIQTQTECSDTLDRFALVKSYSVCSDLIDMEAMSATSQYLL